LHSSVFFGFFAGIFGQVETSQVDHHRQVGIFMLRIESAAFVWGLF
jgi:hypothetical protein